MDETVYAAQYSRALTGPVRAWHLTAEEARSLLESAATRDDLKRAEHVLRDIWPDYTEVPHPDTSNDYAYAAWRMANRGDELGRLDFTMFTRRHREAVRRALEAGEPVPPHVVESSRPS